MKYTDPTGHMVSCGLDYSNGCEGFGPERILASYESESERDSVLDVFLRTHSSYNPVLDLIYKNPQANVRIWYSFYQSRQRYWHSRGNFSNAEVDKLIQYYDYRQTVVETKFSTANVPKDALLLDFVGIGLSIFGLKAVGAVSEGTMNLALGANLGLSAYSTGQAIYEGDPFGMVTNGVSYFPGPAGVMGGIGSVLNDISQGFYQVTWLPSVPR